MPKPTERILRGSGKSLEGLTPEAFASMGGVADAWKRKRGLSDEDMGINWLESQRGGYPPSYLGEDAEGGQAAYLSSLSNLAAKHGWEGKAGEIPEIDFIKRAIFQSNALDSTPAKRDRFVRNWYPGLDPKTRGGVMAGGE